MRLSDSAAVIALNMEVVHVTSAMDHARFTELFELSHYKWAVETDGLLVGFVMVIRHGATYDNGNYHWFSERFENFLYVDRIVVSADHARCGIGRLLYCRIFECEADSGALPVCAEMDLEPPNNASLRFHGRAGFVQVGTRVLRSGKRVSMQVRDEALDRSQSCG